MPARINLSFDLGEHWPLLLTCHEDQAGGVVMDLTGAQAVVFRMAHTGGDDLVADLNGGVTVLSPPTNGQALILITPTMQSGIIGRNCTYTVRVTMADGTISDQACGSVSLRGTEFPAP